MSRADRRALAERYRQVSRTWTCPTCGATVGATFVIERGEPYPDVVFAHGIDGTHRPVITGDSAAARAMRDGHVIGRTGGTLT